MHALKLTQIGNSVGVILPREMLAKLGMAKGDTIYAFVQGWPEGQATIASLGSSSPQHPAKVTSASMLGYDGHLKFAQDGDALRVTLPGNRPPTADIGITLKLTTT